MPPKQPAPAGEGHDSAAVIAKINPPRSRRWAIVLCFPLFLALAAPYWWYTTSIVRLPLPTERISALEGVIDPQIRTLVSISADDTAFPAAPAGRSDFPTSEKLDALRTEVVMGVDGILGRDRPAVRGQRRWDMVVDGPKSVRHRIHIAVSDAADPKFPLRPYVQAPWAHSPEAGTVVVPVHPSLVGDLNLKRHYKIALVNAVHNLLPAHLPPIANRALAYSPNITLSFVVVNEDASDGSFVDAWDIEGALRDHITPHLEPLAPVFNFSIESQVLHHAPLAFEPTYGEAGWIVDEDGMKMFVSERWTLDSLSTNNPVLKFILFVPSASHRPLRLSVDNANAFLIPQFGSVVLLNPPSSSSGANMLTLAALDAPFAQFTEHLYALLSIPSLPTQISPCPCPSSSFSSLSNSSTSNSTSNSNPRTRAQRGLRDPLTRWQLDTVLRVRMAENAGEARKTLSGIVRLVDKIGEMQVGPGVRDKVLGAVERMERLPETEGDNSPLGAFLLSRDAVGLANEAFFDPSMMGLLYFPDQHKFAVYTPLFAPIGVSIVVGILREIANLIKKRKAARKAAQEAKAQKANNEGPQVDGPSQGTTTALDAPAGVRLRTTASAIDPNNT